MKITPADNWKSRVQGFSGRSNKVPPLPFISAGKVYSVYGISWKKDSFYYSDSPVVQIFDDYDNLVIAPLLVFEIIDGLLPALWRASSDENGFTICPDLFRRDFFFDDVSEKEPSVLDELRELRMQIEGSGQD